MEIYYCVGAILIGLFSYLGGKSKGFRDGYAAGASAYRDFILKSTSSILEKMKNDAKNERPYNDEEL